MRCGHREQDVVAGSQLGTLRAHLHYGVPTEDVGTAFEGMNVAVYPPTGGKPAQTELCVHCTRNPADETIAPGKPREHERCNREAHRHHRMTSPTSWQKCISGSSLLAHCESNTLHQLLERQACRFTQAVARWRQ